MNKVFFDVAISLDGFMAGPNRGPSNPLWDKGMELHQWMFKQKVFLEHLGSSGGEDGKDGEIIRETLQRTGAVIMGKRMFEEGETNWPEDLFKMDVYVLTNEKREPWKQKGNTTFYFVNDGIESALKKARQSAGEKDIRINGGAETIQAYLNGGFIDEFILHVTPILLKEGIRLFENVEPKPNQFEIVSTVSSDVTTHIKYRLDKKS